MTKKDTGWGFYAVLGLAGFSVTLAAVPALPLLARQSGAGDLALGLILAAAAAAGLAVRLPLRRLAEGHGRVLWLGAAAVLCAAPLLYLLALTPLLLGLLRIVHGLGVGVFFMLALGRASGAREQRQRATTILFGLTLAPVVGGAILAAGAMRAVYLASAAAGLAALGLALALRELPGQAAIPSYGDALRRAWHNRAAQIGMLALAAQFALYGGLLAFLPLLAGSLEVDLLAVGLAFGLLAGGRSLGAPLADWLAGRFGRKAVFSVGLYLSAFAMVVFPAVTQPYAVLLVPGLALAFGLGLGVSLEELPAFLGEGGRETLATALQALEEIGLATGPLLMGILLQANGRQYWMGFVLTATLVVLLAFAFNVAAPEIRLTLGRRK